MKRLEMTFILALLILISASSQQQKLRIFGLGNSFMEDMLFQVPELLEQDTSLVDLSYLHINGGSLSDHLKLITSDEPEYTFSHYDNSEMQWVKDTVRFSDVINLHKWDVIILQQSSQYSGKQDKTISDLEKLIKTLEEYHRDAAYYWHITWAYASDSNHPGFSFYDHSQLRMNYDITKLSFQIICEKFKSFFDGSIPSCAVIQLLRESYLEEENDFCYDTYHIDRILGRYALACTFYESVLSPLLHKSLLSDVTAIPSDDSMHGTDDFLFIRQIVDSVVHNEQLKWRELLADKIYRTDYYDLQGNPQIHTPANSVSITRSIHLSGTISYKKIYLTDH